MTIKSLMDYVWMAMQPEFTVFGVTLNFASYFVFSIVIGVIVWFIRKLME